MVSSNQPEGLDCVERNPFRRVVVWLTTKGARGIDFAQRIDPAFLRQLFAEPRFGVAAALCLIVLSGTAASGLRLWRVTPRGFIPEIRISGFDALEARMESRAARACWVRHDDSGALNHWRASVNANPADPIALRELVRTEGHLPQRNRAALDRLGGEVQWLLRLTATNRADLDLAVQVLDSLHAEELLGAVLAADRADRSPFQRRERAKWHLRSGRFDAFEAEARTLTALDTASDSSWPLYWLAWIAGTDLSDRGAEALRSLREEEASNTESGPASDSTRTHLICLRLEYVVSMHRQDPHAVRIALSRLREARGDTPVDHARFWNLLANLGREDEARTLAQSFADPPVTVDELEWIGASLVRLGLTNEAVDSYRRWCERPEGRGRIWVTLGSLLVRLERWREAGDLAGQMRSHPTEVVSWIGYSHYLDGLSLLANGQTNAALGTLRRMLEPSRFDPGALVTVGSDLIHRGFPEITAELLLRHESGASESVRYWQTLVQAALVLQDSSLLLQAAQREWDLKPESLDATNDLAVALLINEREPERARELTRRVLELDPGSSSALIHHSLALLGTGQVRAARPLLESVDLDSLTPRQRHALAYARVLLGSQSGRPVEVAREMQFLRPAWLFPGQIARVEHLVELASAGTLPR